MYQTKFKSEVQFIEDIIQIKIDVPFQVKFVYVYLMKVGNSFLLFDAGLNIGNWPETFFSTLNELDISVHQISHCFVSHDHLDHIGLIGILKEKNPHIKILLHDITNKELKWETEKENRKMVKQRAEKLTQEILKYGLTEKQGERLINYFLTWPRMKEYHQPDFILKDGDIINIENRKYEIVWTPGHSLGHICVFEHKSRYLFSGDHILSRITPHIGVFLIDPLIEQDYNEYNFDNILSLYLNSLDKIQKLNPNIIFPAHQEVIYDPIDRINAIKNHHENRLQEISKAIADKPRLPYEIAQIHFGKLDEINSFLALSEVIAHLKYLEDEGKVKRIHNNGKIYFQVKKQYLSKKKDT